MKAITVTRVKRGRKEAAVMEKNGNTKKVLDFCVECVLYQNGRNF